jgi:hypothetical protein
MLEALSGGKPISLQRMVISSRTIDAFAASVRSDMIAGELAGGRARRALGRAVLRRGEEEAGFGLAAPERAGEIGADFVVNIILLIGRTVTPFPLPFLGISSFLRDSARRVRQNLAIP